MRNANFSHKTIDILAFLAMPHGVARMERLATLDVRYSTKAVNRKLEELAQRGYVNEAGLTAKGRAALEAAART